MVHHCVRRLSSAPTADDRFAAPPPASTSTTIVTRKSRLTVCMRHSRPHHDTSTEFQHQPGRSPSVPLPGHRSSLVWVLDAAQADAFAALDDHDLSGEIERASHSILGKIEVETGRGLFPLHSRDRATICRQAHRAGRRSGACHPADRRARTESGPARCRRHRRTRGRCRPRAGTISAAPTCWRPTTGCAAADVGSRTLAIDLLNRTLLTDFLPVQGARGLGLYLIDRIGPLRRAVMREGVAPAAAQPRLMRGEAL